jgi:glycosyltransferase involved in cell wall biosynthesis
MVSELSSSIEVADHAALVKAPLISVRMITYNHGAFLAQAIEGVMSQQTEYPFELLIGEDCSKDNTREIALSFQRRQPDKIRVIYSDSNVGWRANSARVFLKCRGKYHAFCEGDDYWHDPFKLQRQVSFLEGHPEHVLVHSAFRVQTGQAIRPGQAVAGDIPTGRIFERLLEANFIATCTVCVSRSIAADYFASKFREKGYLTGDYPHWLFASQQGLIGYMAGPLATYRVCAGSLTHKDPANALRMALSARRVGEDFIGEYGCSPEALSRSRKCMNLRVMRAAFCARDRETFLREYQWYRENNPDWGQDYGTRARFVATKLHLPGSVRILQMLRHSMAQWKRPGKSGGGE